MHKDWLALEIVSPSRLNWCSFVARMVGRESLSQGEKTRKNDRVISGPNFLEDVARNPTNLDATATLSYMWIPRSLPRPVRKRRASKITHEMNISYRLAIRKRIARS